MIRKPIFMVDGYDILTHVIWLGLPQQKF